MMMPRVSGRAAGRRATAAVAAARAGPAAKTVQKPTLESFLEKRDYSGAIALLQFERHGESSEYKEEELLNWLTYSAFHAGEFTQAVDALDELLSRPGADQRAHLYKACCLFYMRMYSEARKAAEAGPNSPLRNRLLFHLAHRLGMDELLMQCHSNLTQSKEDQMSFAAIHFARGHYQQATDIYKRLLLENRVDLALNVYVAMCYYKLDYYDVSLEILGVFFQSHRDSPVAINLKACNHFRLYNGKAAEAELRVLTDGGFNIGDHPLLRHNQVVFRGGQNALQVLPPLLEVLPEARLNLAIYYLNHGDIAEAYDLMKGIEPAAPPEYILKAIVHAMQGQATGSRELLTVAQDLFQLVGGSATECDTIPGRQCMSSCFFLLRQFEDVNVYLSSIKAYLYNDDNFNWNYGVSLASVGKFKEAEECLLLVQNERYRADYVYVSWLARCHIMSGKPRLAWELYLKMDSSNESYSLLQLIANDSYKMGHFYYAAKAFDILERLDPDPEYWDGKRGACVGVFQQFIAARQRRDPSGVTADNLREVLVMLRNTTNPQVEYIVRVIRKWCAENNIKEAL